MKKVTLMIIFAALVASAAVAQTPTVMNYQGRLTDNAPGQNPIDTTLPMDFVIYDSMIGGASVWTEPWLGVTVVDGIFSVLLGSNGVPLTSAVFTGGSVRYLEIIIDGETLSPRQQIGTVGFADVAASADDVDCVGCVNGVDILDSTIQSTDIAANTITAADIASNAVGASEIATNAVGAAEIAANAVGASEITTNAVGNSELNNTSAFTFSNLLTLDSNTGQKIITSRSGITKIELWADTTSSYLYHRPAASYFAVNDATGNWGIGTTGATHRFQVNGNARVTSTLQADSNVDVAGTVLMGWERVFASNNTSTTSSSCFQGGSAWTCYTGFVDANCSSGKTILGGGCVSSGITDSISYGYPLDSNTYRCHNAEDNASQPFTAYAICARIGN